MTAQTQPTSIQVQVPDERWRRRACMTLLGCDWRGRAVVLTPIRSIHAALARGGTECDGWWRTSLIGDAAVVHVPQGTAAKDIVFALPQPTRITFVGLAGGLRNQPIGTIVDPESAFIAEPPAGKPSQSSFPARLPFHARSHPTKSPLLGGVAATVGCLADSTLLHHLLASTADCVDMESAHLFSAATLAGHQLRCLLVISDHNRDGDVFTSTPERIAAAIDDLRQSIQEDLNGGQ